MKKNLLILIASLLVANTAVAQQNEGRWTFNTRGWTTNYYSTLIFGAIEHSVKTVLNKNGCKDSIWVDRVIPTVDLVFPVGIEKKGFRNENTIYGPYHRAFGHPFFHLGDYAIGADASYLSKGIGFYAGAYFKSQEIVFKHHGNLRGFYFQPRAGLKIGGKHSSLEAGMFYDVVAGCEGSTPGADADRLKSGWGLDFSYAVGDKKGKAEYILQFSMPLHNFLDQNVPGQEHMKRKVGYIMLTRRIRL